MGEDISNKMYRLVFLGFALVDRYFFLPEQYLVMRLFKKSWIPPIRHLKDEQKLETTLFCCSFDILLIVSKIQISNTSYLNARYYHSGKICLVYSEKPNVK